MMAAISAGGGGLKSVASHQVSIAPAEPKDDRNELLNAIRSAGLKSKKSVQDIDAALAQKKTQVQSKQGARGGVCGVGGSRSSRVSAWCTVVFAAFPLQRNICVWPFATAFQFAPNAVSNRCHTGGEINYSAVW